MSAPTSSRRAVPGARRVLVLAAPCLSLALAAGMIGSIPAGADSAIKPRSGRVTVSGAGFGHGIGMSQYGAYGAAVKGLSYQQILRFYYPGTKLAAAPRSTMRVWLTADTDSDTRVVGAAGLSVKDSTGRNVSLPTGSAYRSWRISRSGSGFKLSYRGSSGSYKTRATSLGGSSWTFVSRSNVIKLILPRTTRELRGTLSLVKRGSGGRTVNTLALEDYVRGVVPAEMPTSWHPQAVRVQAVAARTYAARLQSRAPSGNGYDICDTTACQVYRGKGVETANGNAAVAATRGQVLWYGSSVALAMFSSANGGHSISGGLPYLRAAADPYDGVIKSQSWTRTVTASSIARRWSVGTLRSVKITARTGGGRWGGYVTKIVISGSRRSVSITGNNFKSAFGLRSAYFSFGGAGISTPPPTPPTPPAPDPVIPVVSNKPGPRYASFPRSYRSGSTVDLLMVVGNGSLVRFPVAGAKVGTPAVIGTGFGSLSHVLNAGDWNGDGYQDVIGRTTSGRLLLYRGSSTGRMTAGVDLGSAKGYRSLSVVGDMNGDRYPDLVALDSDGVAHLRYGNGRTGWRSSVVLARGWNRVDAVRGVGDVNRDGRPDLLVEQYDRLYLRLGAAQGFGAARLLGPALTGIAAVTAVGDVNRDGYADVVARTSTGGLRLYRFDRRGALLAPLVLTGGYQGTRFAS